MGYKLAGFEHLGGVEIDPKIAEIARKFITDLGGFEKFAEWGLV